MTAPDYADFDLVYRDGAGKLYVGSYPPPGDYRKTFDLMVFCAAEMQPRESAYPGMKIIGIPLDDSDLDSARVRLQINVVALTIAREIHRGHRVLVSCHLGVNRSALIASVAMCILNGKPGWYCGEKVRAARHPRKTKMQVLANSHFQEYLRSIGAGPKLAQA